MVSCAWQDSDSTSRRNQRVLAVNFHQNFTSQNVEELLRVLVVMANLGCARRHNFFDHAQLLIFHEMPTVAVHSPAIVLGVFPAYRNPRA